MRNFISEQYMTKAGSFRAARNGMQIFHSSLCLLIIPRSDLLNSHVPVEVGDSVQCVQVLTEMTSRHAMGFWLRDL
jgi:hypothetical protein